MANRIAVIGGGIGGISIALRMRKKGFEVDLFEKNSELGGKIGEIKTKDYRFDTGPSLFTLPYLIDELFSLFDKPKLSYEKLDVVSKYFWDDGSIIKSYSDADKFANELNDKFNEPKENTLRFLKNVADLYNITADVFIFSSLHKLSFLTKPELRSKIIEARKLKPWLSMYSQLKRQFRSKKVIQIFSRYATYNGSNPYEAPSTLNLIAHLEHNVGAYFPEKGMRSIIEELENLMVEVGINIYKNSLVEKINVNNKKIDNILVNVEKKSYDIVVSDVDVNTLYSNHISGIGIPSKIKNTKLSTSALIFYWGINREFSDLELHNILFANNYKAEFDSLFGLRKIYSDPTVYIFISKKNIKKDAPEGKENWFVMINTPADTGQLSESDIKEARSNIIKKINGVLKTNIEEHIEYEQFNTPKTIENYTSSMAGALYGANSNSMMAAFNRHANFSKRIKNMYFVGGSVHPGGGIPLCVASAKITDKIISDDV